MKMRTTNKKVCIGVCAVLLNLVGMSSIEATTSVSSQTSYTKQELSSMSDQAVHLMESNHFQEAYEILIPLDSNSSDDYNIQFLLGQCLVNLHKPEQAIRYYQKILQKNPNLPRVRLELGKAYAMMGQTAQARKEFNTVLASSPPPVVAGNIRKFIALLDAQKHVNIRADMGLVYDSNVNTGPDDLIVHGYWTIDMRKQADFATSTSISVDVLNPYSSIETWQSNLGYRNNDYFTLHSYSWQDITLNTGPVIYNSTHTFGLPITFKTTYISEQEYNKAYGVSPQWQIKVKDNQQLLFSASLLSQEYLSNSERNGTSYSVSLADRFLLNPKKQGDYIEIGIGSARDLAQQDVFSNQVLSGRMSYYHRFNKSFWTMVQNSYSQADYQGMDTYSAWVLGSTKSRRDQQDSWQVMCGTTVGKWNYTLSYSLSDNVSNIDIYSYTRNLVNIQATSNF